MPLFDRMMEAVNRAIETALGVNLLDMLIQIGATLILVLIVKHFFWGKITDFLEKRKAIMDEEILLTKAANDEAKRLKDQRESEYQELKNKTKSYLDDAREKADQERLRVLEQTKKNAEELIIRTKKEIEAEKNKARMTLEKEVVEMATLMAEKILVKEIDKEKYQDLLVDELERSEKS
jgi:F-type H+-transporting ATPase subunit b